MRLMCQAAADRLRNNLLGAALDVWQAEDGPFGDEEPTWPPPWASSADYVDPARSWDDPAAVTSFPTPGPSLLQLTLAPEELFMKLKALCTLPWMSLFIIVTF